MSGWSDRRSGLSKPTEYKVIVRIEAAFDKLRRTVSMFLRKLNVVFPRFSSYLKNLLPRAALVEVKNFLLQDELVL